MVQKESRLEVADNTGAKEALIIGIPRQLRKTVTVGDIVKVTIKKDTPNGTAKKGKVYDAVIIRTKGVVRREDGSYVSFDNNALVLIDKKTNNPIGTRIFGPVSRELRAKNFMKIISLAPEVV
jgi:large subunit ribosomal protein L14